MGIHTGAAERTSNDSPTGGYASNHTLNRVARILSASHGGQVLLSFATKELVRDSLPAETELRDMGEHHLKNLIRPEHLFQLIIADLPADFPPLNTLDSTRHNLPVQLTSFIGRTREMAEVKYLLSATHLLTLIGPGGTGKTRLSTQIASELLDIYPDGAWIVELAPISEPLLLPRTTAIAIGLRDEPHRPVIDMLCDYLRGKQLLLILDNCEHLVEACAQLADRLLHACPQIRILASSREALGIAGETSYLVPSLELPDMQNLPTVEVLSQCEAIRLFIERASAATQNFKVTDENASSIAQICHRLDGIPLAIELAAGKIRSLSAGQIAQRLDDRFRLLTGGSRTAMPRHQTLQATIEWSYNLLSASEQTLFRRLSVFVNGWTLEAAESVCSNEDASAKDSLKTEDILELLTQLVNKSLVMTEERHGEVRYHLLETIRQFGSNKLVEASESESLCDRHLEFFIQFAEIADPFLRGAEEIEWLERLDDEHDDLHSALQWTAGKSSAEPALRLAGALAVYWTMRSFWLEGAKWLESALKKAPVELEEMKKGEKAARAKALYGDAMLVQNLHDLEMRRARWHSRLAWTLYGLGSLPESKKHVREALRLLGYPIPKSRTRFVLGLFSQIFQQALHRFFPARFIGIVSSEYERDVVIQVARLYDLMMKIYFYSNETPETLPIMYSVLRFLNIAEKVGISPELANAYSSMAFLALFVQLHSLCETYVDRSIAVAEEVNQPSNLVRVSVITGIYKVTVGKWDEVRARVEEAMVICEQLGNYSRWSECAALLGEHAVIAGDIQYAMNIYNVLLGDARRRRQNPLHHCRGLLGVAANNIRLGNAAAAIPMLEEALQILEENPNLPSSMNPNGRLALAYLRLGQDDKAVIYAGKVLVLAANISISANAYSMDIGFAAVANVYFELWVKTLQDPLRQLDSDKHKLSAEQAIKLLRSFQKVFPIGQPVTPYYQGWYEWLTGKHKAGIKSWNKGLEAAKKFKMPYEEGLIRVKLGSHLQGDPNACREHFERAIQIFEKMGAMYELKVAQEEMKKAGI